MGGGAGQEVKTLCLMLRDVFFKYHTPHGNFTLLTGGDGRNGRGGRSLRDRLPNADVVFRVCVCVCDCVSYVALKVIVRSCGRLLFS